MVRLSIIPSVLDSSSPALPFSVESSTRTLPKVYPSGSVALDRVNNLMLLPGLDKLMSSTLDAEKSGRVIAASCSLA